MPKKIKLNLEDLKIKSFVTSLDDGDAKNVKGGETEGGLSCNWKCGDTEYWECESDACSQDTCDIACTIGFYCSAGC